MTMHLVENPADDLAADPAEDSTEQPAQAVEEGNAAVHAALMASSRVTPALLDRLAAHIALAPGEHARIEVRAPYTGGLLGHVPRARAADVTHAVARARAAQPAWAALGFDARKRIMLRFHDLVLARCEEVLDLVQLESGKARRDAFDEVMDVANVARYYAHRAEAFMRPRRRRGALPLLTKTWELHHPVGTVGFIVPWNYPLNLAVTDAIPALMAGNTAVLKPDHQTSFTALWAADLLYEAGMPHDVFPVITGEGAELGPHLVEQVDFMMFTGSTRTGRIIAHQAAERLIGCSLELGGKNPMIVCADADLDAVVEGLVRSAFVGAGQVCVSIERLYIEASIFDSLVPRLVERTRQIQLGGALDYSVDMGSLASQRQLDTVTRHVQDALAKGATLLAGGRHRPDIGPYFYEPTLLANVTEDMELFSAETFGPVVALYPFDSVDDAVDRANATRYGLNASVWTRDGKKAFALAARIQAGTVSINESFAATWGSVDAPIGGFKESGMSRRHGREGMLKYTEVQTVAMQRLVPISGPPTLARSTYERLMRKTLGLLARIPGLR